MVVLPMDESQQEPEGAPRLRLSDAEAQYLRGLLRCTRVPDVDELTRLRIGKVIAGAIFRSPTQGYGDAYQEHPARD
jgi:hypothetical protein